MMMYLNRNEYWLCSFDISFILIMQSHACGFGIFGAGVLAPNSRQAGWRELAGEAGALLS
jgi:hypothetical protein